MALSSSCTTTPMSRPLLYTCHAQPSSLLPFLPASMPLPKSLLFINNQLLYRFSTLRPNQPVVCMVLNDNHPSPGTITSPTESTPLVCSDVRSLHPTDLPLSKAAQESGIQAQSKARTEQPTYLFAVAAPSVGITFLAAAAVYYRFVWQLQGDQALPYTEIFGTFLFAAAAAVGMEFWARWAHRALWHESLWSMHESHHRYRKGSFELNDVFAIINAVPAISLIAYGFFHEGLIPGLCFGAGLGITLYGMAYMFVHDGLIHRRFPVGPIEKVPYLHRVAAAHQLHHEGIYKGVPYGLFLGPNELEAVGGLKELEKRVKEREEVALG